MPLSGALAVTGCTDGLLPWGFQAYFEHGLLSCKLNCYCGWMICKEWWDGK